MSNNRVVFQIGFQWGGEAILKQLDCNVTVYKTK